MTSDLELDLVSIALYMSGYIIRLESALPSALSFQLLGWRYAYIWRLSVGRSR